MTNKLDATSAKSVLDGVLASDGALVSHGRGAYFVINLSKGELHKDWLTQVKDALVSMGIYVNPLYPKVRDSISKGKRYQLCTLHSDTCLQMKHLRDIWYPDGIKILPTNFELNPVSLANMFMGDGDSSYYLTKRGTPCLTARLSTYNFNEGEVEYIEHSLHNIGVAHTGRIFDKNVKNGSGIRIAIQTKSVDYFMHLIEQHMVPSFAYKVKYTNGGQCGRNS